MSDPRKFTRLRARRRGVIRRASLWDGGDYLLSISGTAFTEGYRRFYYRDIKAIVVQKGPRLGSIGALLLLAFFTLVFGATAAAAVPTAALTHVFWILPLAWLGVIGYLSVARSCRVFVYTAVSSQELPAILRRSAAAVVVPQIADKIREAQGSFGDAYEAALAKEALGSEDRAIENGALSASSQSAVPETAVSLPRQALYATLTYCLTILASAAFAFWYRNVALTPRSLIGAKVLFCTLNAVGVFAGVWTLFKVSHIHLFTGLRAAIYAGLGVLAIRAYALYFLLLTIKVERGFLSETMPGIRWRQWIGTSDCAMSLLVGIAGLILLTFAWQADAASTPARNPDGAIAGGSVSNL